MILFKLEIIKINSPKKKTSTDMVKNPSLFIKVGSKRMTF